LRDGGLISLLMKPFVSHQRAIKRCQRYIISMIDIAYNLCRRVQQQCVHGSRCASTIHRKTTTWEYHRMETKNDFITYHTDNYSS